MFCCHISKSFLVVMARGVRFLVRLENFLVSGQDQLVMFQNVLVCDPPWICLWAAPSAKTWRLVSSIASTGRHQALVGQRKMALIIWDIPASKLETQLDLSQAMVSHVVLELEEAGVDTPGLPLSSAKHIAWNDLI